MCDVFFDGVCFIRAIVERYLTTISLLTRRDFASLTLNAGHFMHDLGVTVVVDGSKMAGGTVVVDATMRADGVILANGAAA